MDELLATSRLLSSALARYMDACTTVTKLYDPSNGRQLKYRTLIDGISRELYTVAGYVTDIQTAKSTLAQCRNLVPNIVSFNALPSEVISQIFTLIHNSGPCLIDARATAGDSDSDISLLMLADPLPHVCSRWRQITLSIFALWTHVDIIISSKWGERLLHRAETLAARTGLMRSHLYIFISKNSIFKNNAGASAAFQRQLNLVSSLTTPVIGSFRLDTEAYEDHFPSVIRDIVPKVLPGMLSELSLSDRFGLGYYIIVPNDFKESALEWTVHEFNPLVLNMPARMLDAILRPIKALRLHNILFLPTSQVYAGLVDLRLDASSGWDPISSIPFFSKVLSSCPGLRIFHCSLDISFPDLKSPIHPIPLKEIEVLRLQGMVPPEAEQLLAYIHPGSMPLDLYLPIGGNGFQPPDIFLRTPVREFFTRSHVTRLFLEEYQWNIESGSNRLYVPLARMLSEIPVGLCALGLAHIGVYLWDEKIASWPAQLSALTMYSCDCEIYSFQRITSLCPIQELKVFDLLTETKSEERAITEQLTRLAPIVSVSWDPPKVWSHSVGI